MKKLILTALLSSLLAGCGSSVKLDTPVEDRAGAAISGSSATQSAVVPVDSSSSGLDQAGPAGAAQVIYFDFDSYVIPAASQPVVDAHANFLKADHTRRAMLEGHTDERGGREYNLALGQRRAEAVRRALALLGVADSQMEAVSFGKEKPAATSGDEAAMARNRRVEFKYR